MTTTADPDLDLASLPTAGRSYLRVADVAVERTPILMECAAVRNGNPLFWDQVFARRTAGGDVAPPSMLSTWGRPHLWDPATDAETPMPLQLHFDLKRHFGYPAAVVADYLMTLHDPVRVGDTITTEQRLVSVSPPKQTRMGTGRFWSLDVDYRNQDDDLVGVESWTMFSYHPATDDGAGAP